MTYRRVVFVDFLAAVAAGQVTRARAFMRRVYEIDTESRFVVLRARGVLEDVVLPGPRTTVIDVDLKGGRFKGIRRVLWETRHVAGLIAQHQADVYLTFSHFLPWGVDCSVRIVGVSNMAPFSQEALEVDDFPGAIRLRLLRWLIVSSAKRATHVVALSAVCRDALIRSGLEARRILVLSNGCDDFVAALAADNGAGRDLVPSRPYVLCVSHFYPYKNFEVLLEGFAALNGRLRQKYSLVIVGMPVDREYYERIAARAKELASRCTIVILPGVPHTALLALYSGAMVFAFSSLVENCPNALLEAMSAGLPMAVARREPMPEFAMEAALYFDPYTPRDAAEVLGRLLDDANLRGRLSRRARERSEQYRWDTLVRGTVAAYNPVLQK